MFVWAMLGHVCLVVQGPANGGYLNLNILSNYLNLLWLYHAISKDILEYVGVCQRNLVLMPLICLISWKGFGCGCGCMFFFFFGSFSDGFLML